MLSKDMFSSNTPQKGMGSGRQVSIKKGWV